MNGGRFAEAAATARALLTRHPDVGVLWKLYGAAVLRQGGDALPILQRAIELLPADPDIHHDLGTALRRQGDFAAAMTSYQRALDLHPTHLPALVELASALHVSGRPLEAATTYHRALQIAPGVPELHNNLGNALRDGGQPDQALASYRRALSLKPDFAQAHNNMGAALRRLGQPAEAAECYRRAIALEPDLAEAHNNLGNALRDQGHLDPALASYRRALELNPNLADAHCNLGNALRDLGHLQEALTRYQHAIELDPSRPEPHNNLANTHLDLMQLDQAEASYRKALQLKPDYIHAHTSLARVLRQQGRAAAAEETCRRALNLKPDSADIADIPETADSADTVAFLAELHADRGEFSEAEALFKRALEIDPDLPAARAGLVHCRRMTAADSAWLPAAQRLLARRLPLRQEIYLRFAMGKYFDDLQDYPNAFENYRHANELTRKHAPIFDRSDFTRQIDRICDTGTPEWLRRVHNPNESSERPIFIVGMPRSGTSLAEQILASHPQAFGAGELSFWHEAATVFDESPLHESTQASTITGLAQTYLRQLAALSPDARRVIDKMPTNFKLLGLIHAALPNARILHMQRHPIDTCLSIYFQNFSIAHTYASDLEDLAHYYSEYRRLMVHWSATLPPGTILDVSYEKLVSHPEESIRTLLEFVGLHWDDRCLESHATPRTVITPSKWQVRQKINSTSVDRWRHYERFIGPLRCLG